jgi:hypothetical protein
MTRVITALRKIPDDRWSRPYVRSNEKSVEWFSLALKRTMTHKYVAQLHKSPCISFCMETVSHLSLWDVSEHRRNLQLQWRMGHSMKATSDAPGCEVTSPNAVWPYEGCLFDATTADRHSCTEMKDHWNSRITYHRRSVNKELTSVMIVTQLMSSACRSYRKLSGYVFFFMYVCWHFEEPSCLHLPPSSLKHYVPHSRWWPLTLLISSPCTAAGLLVLFLYTQKALLYYDTLNSSSLQTVLCPKQDKNDSLMNYMDQSLS